MVAVAGINKIDVLKIDAQGNTLKCLRGAKKLLKNRRVNFVQAEIIFSGFYDVSDSLTDILVFMQSVDYKLYTIVHGDSEQIGHVFYDFSSGEIRGFDAIFVPAKP